MFEKEAEEYTDKHVVPIRQVSETDLYYAFKDGAEFGYNKASEDFAKQLKEVVETCNHWQEVAEKANEWHYVKDGDLPKDERWVCNQDGCYCYYDIDTEQWLDIEGTRTRTIEWCDMPKFKE